MPDFCRTPKLVLARPQGHNLFWELHCRGEDPLHEEWPAWRMPTSDYMTIPSWSSHLDGTGSVPPFLGLQERLEVRAKLDRYLEPDAAQVNGGQSEWAYL